MAVPPHDRAASSGGLLSPDRGRRGQRDDARRPRVIGTERECRGAVRPAAVTCSLARPRRPHPARIERIPASCRSRATSPCPGGVGSPTASSVPPIGVGMNLQFLPSR